MFARSRWLLLLHALTCAMAVALAGCTPVRASGQPSTYADAPPALALQLIQNDLERRVLDLNRAAELDLRPLRAAQSTAAKRLAAEVKLEPACFVPDLKTEDEVRACGERAWWFEGGQVKRPQKPAALQPATPPK